MGNSIKINEININKALKILKLSNLVLEFEERDDVRGYSIKNVDGKAVISYNEPCDLFRAFLYISQNGVKNIAQTRKFEKLGYMIDVARNAVPKIETIKKMVDHLAILGYNRLYVYLEDLFEIKEEPFFGYMRGRYTEEELKELDEYCFEYGIELVPCIQTLAHLNAIFVWPEYQKCNDIADILLVNCDRTYQLIDNMFKAVSRIFKSKTLHIGMDEAIALGRGTYLNKNGYKNGYEVMAEHVNKVMEIAKPYGFDLMLWSDMYFRLAFGGAYYSATGKLDEKVADQIPNDLTLFYWDYYNRDEKMVTHVMKEHLKLSPNVAFAGGAWKWTGWTPATSLSLKTSKVALDVCLNEGIKNIMLTAWSDDGAEASLFATLPTVVYYAERNYNSETTESDIDKKLQLLFGLSLEDFYSADMLLISKNEYEENYLFGKLPKVLLYNDPLSGVYDGVIKKYDILSNINKNILDLKKVVKNAPKEFKYIFENLLNLAKVLQFKAKLGIDIRAFYKEGNIEELKNIVNLRIPTLIKRLKFFEKGFYNQWMLENKSNGYQTHDLRLGGLIKRLQTVKNILQDYLDGKINKIHELEDDVLQIDGDDALGMLLWKDWKYIHSLYVV